MPRGKRGTGPGARKRLQRALDYPVDPDEYFMIQLSYEEADLIFSALRGLRKGLGTRDAAIATNIMYRLTEQIVTSGGSR